MADGNSIDYASLLCSRLCHDLLNPVGALNNGIELLADETDPAMREQCIGLLGDSARVSAAKLKYYRLAFGSAGGYGDTLPAHEVKDAIEGVFANTGRVKIEWIVAEDSLPKLAAKVLLNLALIAGESLPRGGVLMVGLELVGGAVEIAVRGEGPRLTLDKDIRRALAGTLPASEISSRTVSAAMSRQLVADRGGEIMLSDPEQPLILFGAHIPA
ncbi:histidine phosphotransferase [Sphingobium sufflavum]|uniref:histidine phosphotransferase family protein n=1 Tax=Sphingobium sufflavum TaxID=1129547 RepID=UPI001F1BB78F|nr:histidine phosphotransferase family protein [Sphingobium sufflavum]MCE7798496.1 histidine phosphotransferase [Sphingobium sufflavum]